MIMINDDCHSITDTAREDTPIHHNEDKKYMENLILVINDDTSSQCCWCSDTTLCICFIQNVYSSSTAKTPIKKAKSPKKRKRKDPNEPQKYASGKFLWAFKI